MQFWKPVENTFLWRLTRWMRCIYDFKFLHFLELGAWGGWWLRDLVGFAMVACSCAKTAESSGSQSPWKGPNSSSSVIGPRTSSGSPPHRFWKLHKKSIIRHTNVCNNTTQQCASVWESDGTLKGQFNPEQKMHIPEICCAVTQTIYTFLESFMEELFFFYVIMYHSTQSCSVTEPWLILFLYIITGNYVLLHLLLKLLTLSLPVIT